MTVDRINVFSIHLLQRLNNPTVNVIATGRGEQTGRICRWASGRVSSLQSPAFSPSFPPTPTPAGWPGPGESSSG